MPGRMLAVIPSRINVWGIVGAFALALLAGCSAPVRELDALEFSYPAIRKARAKLREGDQPAALELFKKAIDEKPALAQAHLEAAQLYDNFARNYLRAIYHYERYLELRPRTEKQEMIEGFIRKARIAYVAAIADQAPGLDKKITILQEENDRLKVSLRQVRANLAQQIAATPLERPVPTADNPPVVKPALGPMLTAEPAPADKPTATHYAVQRGDTLSAVAGRFYQDPRKWKLIYDANQDVLHGSQHLKPGQVLVVPP
ncbi:MAG: LysM peptidoglycan-binding domain-containing protein [Lentisphaerae bacterium]|nr:LysM peptidoglycan-binding domain-containing protein [Lentisphaerota bacterium]